MSRNNLKERAIELLQDHPEGLTILEIAKLSGAHRHTITKYIYELLGADIIGIREVSTAKLCFLKKENFIPLKKEPTKENPRKEISTDSPVQLTENKNNKEDSNEA